MIGYTSQANKEVFTLQNIPRAGFNMATGRFWPAGRMFDTPGIDG